MKDTIEIQLNNLIELIQKLPDRIADAIDYRNRVNELKIREQKLNDRMNEKHKMDDKRG
jgi:uncharacterized protein YqgV (UPF0045/DUF77 family)